MKKKLLVAVLTAIALLTCAIGLSACNFNIGGYTSSKDTVDGDGKTETDKNPDDGGKTEEDKKPDVEELKENGLKYELSTDGTYYICKGILDDNIAPAEIVIANTYSDIPVKIEESAFSSCSSLTSVIIGNSVTSIGRGAFYECLSLTSVIIGNSVSSIENYAFYGCSKLTSVAIGNGVTSIGVGAFNGCSVLQYKAYDNGLYLGNSENSHLWLIKAKNNDITSCTINSNTKFISRDAFNDCSKLTSIDIPNSVTSIEDRAFQKCSSLTSVKIGNSVTSIGEWVFAYCSSLESVIMGGSVMSIGSMTFFDCSVLQYEAYDNGLYLGNSENSHLWLIKAKNNDITSCTINTNTKFICREAFSNCSKLTSIDIPNSVTSIGDFAFYNCSSLESVTIGDSVKSIEGYAFVTCSSLNTINYNGTTSQWNAITKGDSWKKNVPSTCKVVCTDGEIAIADA